MYDEQTLLAAHKHSIRHIEEITASEVCGCFYCKHTFSSKEILEWADAGQTALCPKCEIDSVIGDKSGYPVADQEFLDEMNHFWF